MYFNIENILYLYSFVALALIIYNIRELFLINREKEKREYLVNKYNEEIKNKILSLKEEKQIDESYINILAKELGKVDNLLAFRDAMVKNKDDRYIRLYKDIIYDSFVELSLHYSKKNDMEKALFVYIIGVMEIERENSRRLDNIIINFLKNPSVYLVENTIKAFIKLGHKDSLIKTLNILNFNGIYHNEKLVSDGLLEYRGNKLDLAKELWEYRNEWMVSYVIAVIKFIRMIGCDFKEEFYNALKNENLNIEIKLELIRYFGKFKYDKVLDYMIDLFEKEDKVDRNFLIVISTVLSSYPSKRTIEILKKGMTNSNWYIRNNSCSSFLSLKPSQDDINDILNGKDRYAKEALLYQLEKGD